MDSPLQIGQTQLGPVLFLRSAQLFLCVEMKLAFAMLTISDEAEGLLNRIFRDGFHLYISPVLTWCELTMRGELTIWSCALYAPKLD